MIAPPERLSSLQPQLVFAHSDSAYAALSGRRFRRLGWEVHLASTAREAHRLADAVCPDIVVLDVSLRDESGWLTCDKLVRAHPEAKIILLGRDLRAQDHRFAEFVGATALVSRDDGIQALIDEVHGTVLAAAG
jgi:DNA-binding response OmpR family regulator